MRVANWPSLAALAACAVPFAAAAEDLPKRKAGLWEISTQFNGRPSPVGAIQNCVDERTDNIIQQGVGEIGPKCEQRSWRKDGDGYVFSSVCKAGETKVSTNGRFTGSFDSSYKGEIHTAYEPPMHGLSKSDMVLTAKWLGPCKPGQKAGDVTMPNMQNIPGMPKSINMEDLMKMRDQMKRMQR